MKGKVWILGTFLLLAGLGTKGARADIPREITNDLKMTLVLIPAGEFLMGGRRGGAEDERPSHRVKISNSFYMDTGEVTQEAYEKVMQENPSKFKGKLNPVDQVFWDDALKFCRALTQREREAGKISLDQLYRLPTEAEWEYACRAGTDKDYSFKGRRTKLKLFAWHKENSGGKVHPVRRLRANPWGLYDMYGNLWEWCSDWYAPEHYASKKKGELWVDPQGPAGGDYRVVRGGSWDSDADECRSSARFRYRPWRRYSWIGFRVVLTVGKD